MASLFSSLVNNLSEGVRRIKCKFRTMKKNVKYVKLNIIIATVFSNTQTLKMI